ncbi:hypothetical protein cand_028480 [Cryptosporidium andersoni]|uniref:Uncharacterized protein n=1 Tax=Cryptosporidium andersoni TaxID=117008 RepID=A0A1J4MQY9_9CRYT|nr:hypothetical protein cand_028480 [Cryptosporidium andersoni]
MKRKSSLLADSRGLLNALSYIKEECPAFNTEAIEYLFNKQGCISSDPSVFSIAALAAQLFLESILQRSKKIQMSTDGDDNIADSDISISEESLISAVRIENVPNTSVSTYSTILATSKENLHSYEVSKKRHSFD